MKEEGEMEIKRNRKRKKGIYPLGSYVFFDD